MTDIDYAGLREKAEKATSGPWPIIGGNEYISNVGILVGSPEGIAHADAEFIAAANPQTVLALLDEVERLGNELAEAHAHFAIQEGRIAKFKRERDEALVVIEKALREVSPPFEQRSSLHLAAARDILSAAPAGSLRERDAEKWDEGFDRGFYSGQAMPSADASESPVRNPYREETTRG